MADLKGGVEMDARVYWTERVGAAVDDIREIITVEDNRRRNQNSKYNACLHSSRECGGVEDKGDTALCESENSGLFGNTMLGKKMMQTNLFSKTFSRESSTACKDEYRLLSDHAPEEAFSNVKCNRVAERLTRGPSPYSPTRCSSTCSSAYVHPTCDEETNCLYEPNLDGETAEYGQGRQKGACHFLESGVGSRGNKGGYTSQGFRESPEKPLLFAKRSYKLRQIFEMNRRNGVHNNYVSQNIGNKFFLSRRNMIDMCKTNKVRVLISIIIVTFLFLALVTGRRNPIEPNAPTKEEKHYPELNLLNTPTVPSSLTPDSDTSCYPPNTKFYDPETCLGAPFLYVTYHGGIGDRRANEENVSGLKLADMDGEGYASNHRHDESLREVDMAVECCPDYVEESANMEYTQSYQYNKTPFSHEMFPHKYAGYIPTHPGSMKFSSKESQEDLSESDSYLDSRSYEHYPLLESNSDSEAKRPHLSGKVRRLSALPHSPAVMEVGFKENGSDSSSKYVGSKKCKCAKRKVHTVCKYSRDGCVFPPLLQPSKNMDIISLRGMQIVGDNLMVAHSYSAESSILVYGPPLESSANRRNLIQIIDGKGDFPRADHPTSAGHHGRRGGGPHHASSHTSSRQLADQSILRKTTRSQGHLDPNASGEVVDEVTSDNDRGTKTGNHVETSETREQTTGSHQEPLQAKTIDRTEDNSATDHITKTDDKAVKDDNKETKDNTERENNSSVGQIETKKEHVTKGEISSEVPRHIGEQVPDFIPEAVGRNFPAALREKIERHIETDIGREHKKKEKKGARKGRKSAPQADGKRDVAETRSPTKHKPPNNHMEKPKKQHKRKDEGKQETVRAQSLDKVEDQVREKKATKKFETNPLDSSPAAELAFETIHIEKCAKKSRHAKYPPYTNEPSLIHPYGFALPKDKQSLIVSAQGSGKVIRYENILTDKRCSREIIDIGYANSHLRGITTDDLYGYIYIAVTDVGVLVFTEDGHKVDTVKIPSPISLVYDPQLQSLFVTSSTENAIYEIRPTPLNECVKNSGRNLKNIQDNEETLSTSIESEGSAPQTGNIVHKQSEGSNNQWNAKKQRIFKGLEKKASHLTKDRMHEVKRTANKIEKHLKKSVQKDLHKLCKMQIDPPTLWAKHELLKHPTGLAVDDDNLYVMSQDQYSILAFNKTTRQFNRIVLSHLPDSPEYLLLAPA